MTITREEAIKTLYEYRHCFWDKLYEPICMAIKALEQEPCDKYIKEIDHLRKYISKLETQIVEQEPSRVFDEYGNYKYLSDVELTEPNTATSMPSGDLISRQAVLKIIDGWYENNRNTENIEDLIILITYMVSVNPQEPKTGHWISVVDKWGDIVTTVNGYKCSECGEFNAYRDKYCPNCGAKMVEPQERSDKE